LHSLQYFGHFIPAGILPAALSAFQSWPQARSRAYSAWRPSAGLAVEDFAAGAGAAAGVAAAGFSDSALHFSTYAFSVILLAWFAALLDRHSSWQAFSVFFCASEGVAEKATADKITVKQTVEIDRLFISQLQFDLDSLIIGPSLNRVGIQRFIEAKLYLC
jgi:hypothetical protein